MIIFMIGYVCIAIIFCKLFIDSLTEQTETKVRTKVVRKRHLINKEIYDMHIDDAENAVSSIANELDIPLQSDIEGEEEIYL